MGQKIIRLSEGVINKIAAGEVIENPASIVKEMVENSLDAGARRIAVSIMGGGQKLIEVEDDGCGMSEVDARLCFERHATSKIREAEDLHSLVTMGFRGEALAAIAAVSQFELKTSEKEVGVCVKGEGGRILSVSPCARNRGTTFSVRSLFFNTPARKKFQKSPATDTAQVTKTLEMIALAHPEVEFILTVQCKAALHFPVQTQEKRIAAVAGPFAHSLAGERLSGALSSPGEARPQRRGQFLFVNKRPIFSPLVAKAVQMGYGTRLPANHYPPFVLFLRVDPAVVDVNVHPQKKEVRFSEESSLFREVEQAVASVFETPSFPQALAPFSFDPPPIFSLAEEAPSHSIAFADMTLPLEIEARMIAALDHYAIVEKGGLFLVDLAKAHARILVEDLGEGSKERQTLMWPLEVESEAPEEEALALQKLGIECRALGEKLLAVDALPSSLEPALFPQFFAAWQSGKRVDTAVMNYCRGLKKRYSLEEAHLLWRRLQKCRDRVYDPLGRQIAVEIQRDDLEKIMEKR